MAFAADRNVVVVIASGLVPVGEPETAGKQPLWTSVQDAGQTAPAGEFTAERGISALCHR
jgi:hypothetical protein